MGLCQKYDSAPLRASAYHKGPLFLTPVVGCPKYWIRSQQPETLAAVPVCLWTVASLSVQLAERMSLFSKAVTLLVWFTNIVDVNDESKKQYYWRIGFGWQQIGFSVLGRQSDSGSIVRHSYIVMGFSPKLANVLAGCFIKSAHQPHHSLRPMFFPSARGFQFSENRCSSKTIPAFHWVPNLSNDQRPKTPVGHFGRLILPASEKMR